jgi:hypothetical protein
LGEAQSNCTIGCDIDLIALPREDTAEGFCQFYFVIY